MEESDLLKKRREKLALLEAEGVELYPSSRRIDNTTGEIRHLFGHMTAEELEEKKPQVTIAGRMMAIRDFGKACFISLQDRHGRIQGYIGKQNVGEESYRLFKKFDIGDIVFLAGRVFRTKTGELTVEAKEIQLLSKAILPLPEKWHGLTDVEIRYRQRHLDLIVNPQVREVFIRRSRIISLIRQFMEARDFLEVETPMMQPQAGGAAARPFKTYHNALGMELYLRIAPELYLKRLVTGGLERVFEINRNFRNEGVSTLHNPEFTMMEFYQAYATYEDLMTLTEELFTFLAQQVFGQLKFTYQGKEIDLSPPWPRLTMKEAIRMYGQTNPGVLEDVREMVKWAREKGLAIDDTQSYGKMLVQIFELIVEPHLWQPTFITQYPVEVSPLARKNSYDPRFVDRFELYIAGREIANAFSELNDPREQKERFLAQLKEREKGDEEAHVMDKDFIRCLEYGMPPTAGEGIGIDRLVMLFTDSPSIRDVILFPHMRSKEEES
ncbi:MAG: lysine--tRNA ligase [Syntrophales bacterium]|nr:lysine--tRNA ligase [Syntrophales bacterium]